MSLQDEDEQTSECIDINNNMMTDEETFLHDKEDSQPSDSFFRDLFTVYDTDGLGYILVENFFEISKQNMMDSFDESKLRELVQILDPTGCGRIEYYEFVEGMTRMMSDKTESYVEGQEMISRSRSSTFMEGEVPVLQTHNNLTEEIFENYEPDTPDSSNKTSSNDFDFADEDSRSYQEDEGQDLFGLDSNMINNHRKSLSIRKSISMGGMVKNSRRLSMQNRIDQDLIDHTTDAYDDNQGCNESSTKYERIIEDLEFRIKKIEQQNENLKHEISEQISKNKYQSVENSNLMVKIREMEDQNLELERKFQVLIEEENNRHQETLNRLYSTQIEDRENFLNQIRNLESTSNQQRVENVNNLKEIEELNKISDEKEIRLVQEISKLKELTSQLQDSLDEIDILKDTKDKLKQDYEEQIDQSNKELYDLKLQLENAQQEQFYQRKNTLYDESYYLNQIKQLENENQTFKNEIQNLNSNLEELHANIKIFKTNIHEDEMSSLVDGHVLNTGFMSKSDTQESFLSEIANSKEDELLEKLIEERKNTQRLRDYVEELTSKILEHNPSILESRTVTISSPSKSNKTPSSATAKIEKFSYRRLFKLVN